MVRLNRLDEIEEYKPMIRVSPSQYLAKKDLRVSADMAGFQSKEEDISGIAILWV
jgi:hypothetical protein